MVAQLILAAAAFVPLPENVQALKFGWPSAPQVPDFTSKLSVMSVTALGMSVKLMEFGEELAFEALIAYATLLPVGTTVGAVLPGQSVMPLPAVKAIAPFQLEPINPLQLIEQLYV